MQGRFSTKRDSLKSNHSAGGTIGDPIKRDKLFFFGAYQYTAVKSNPTSTQSTVFTQQMLDGDFTMFAISPGQFSTPWLNILKHIPVARASSPCA